MKKLYYVLGMYIILEDIIINEGFLHPIWVYYITCHAFPASIEVSNETLIMLDSSDRIPWVNWYIKLFF